MAGRILRASLPDRLLGARPQPVAGTRLPTVRSTTSCRRPTPPWSARIGRRAEGWCWWPITRPRPGPLAARGVRNPDCSPGLGASAASAALDELPLVLMAAGLAACDGVEAAAGSGPMKWPNDLVVADRKLAGLLSEAAGGKPAVILGRASNVAPAPTGRAGRRGDQLRGGGLCSGRPAQLLVASSRRGVPLRHRPDRQTGTTRFALREDSATIGRRVRSS